jgi:hypothetical protein
VYKGMDVVMDINQVEVDEYDKPLVDVKILNHQNIMIIMDKKIEKKIDKYQFSLRELLG